MNKTKDMKKINLINYFWVFPFFLISCSQNPTKAVDNKSVINEQQFINKDFVRFQSKFKTMTLDKFKELGDEFNKHYLANDGGLIEVAKVYKENYIKKMNSENLYYGFKTELPNKSVILTFLKHFGAENNNENEVIDTTFFISIVYSDLGKTLCSFRTFGSNLSGEPPTYNMTSTFDFEKNKLIINNYEYSTGKSYAEAIPSGKDSILIANLVVTKYSLDFTTNKINMINRVRRKAKVIETYPESYPVYLKLIE